MNKKTLAMPLAAALMTVAPFAAAAQDMQNKFGFETGVSTLGFYIGPHYKANDNLVARLPIYFGKIDLDEQFDNNDFNGSFDTASAGLMADYHPFRGGFSSGFRLSGGVVVGGYNLSADVTDPEVDGTVYTGTTEMEFKQSDSLAPVLAIGYAKTFNNGFGILAEIGAKFGTYTVTASSDFLTGTPLQADFEEGIRNFNQDLQDLPAIPFLTLGVSYRF